MLENVDSISGAKRKQNLLDHADEARVSKQLATAVREIDLDVDLDSVVAREPDRSRLRETFREFELRAPLERLEEALGEDGAAPAERVSEMVRASARAVPLTELGRLEGELVAVAALRPGEAPDEGSAAAAPTDPDEEPSSRPRGSRVVGPRRRWRLSAAPPPAGLVRLRCRTRRPVHRGRLGG